MKIKYDQKYLDELLKNNFLVRKTKEYTDACEKGEKQAFQFLDENPDFIQMMMHVADTDKIEVIYEEEDLKFKQQSESPEPQAEDSLRSEAFFQDDQDPSHPIL